MSLFAGGGGQILDWIIPAETPLYVAIPAAVLLLVAAVWIKLRWDRWAEKK